MSDPATLRKLTDLERRLAALEALERPYSRIGARVYNSANLSINNSTTPALTFDSERYDTAGLHSTSVNTGRLTAPVAGVYLIAATIAFDNNVTGNRQVQFEVNGTTTIQVVNNDAETGFVFVSIASLYRLAAGDYVQVRVNQTSGGALDVRTLANYSPEFMMHLLG